MESEQLVVYDDVEIHSGFAMLQANRTVHMKPGSKVVSAGMYMCNQARQAADMFTCMPQNALATTKLDFNDVLGRFKEQFPKYGGDGFQVMRFENTWGGLKANYSSYILSMGDVKMEGATIEGPRVGVCAANVELSESKLDVSGHGCPSDYGRGTGVKYATCAGSGGANGGHGGAGGIESTVKGHQDSCRAHTSEPYQFGLAPNFEGSGGASGTPGAHLGGAGGGIIRLLVLNELRMSKSEVLANGTPGTKGASYGSGGGAGGTINLQSRSLKGHSTIEAAGGDGSAGGGGGGAGGRLVVSFNSNYRHDAQPEQSHYWRGTYSIAGGRNGDIDTERGYGAGTSGQSGVVLADKCFGGYSGPFCAPCSTGTFKYDYSYAECKPCENKPANAFYTGMGAPTSDCPYECSSGLDPVEVNPLCKNALELQVNRLGGTVSSLVVFAGFFIVVLFIWIILIAHSQWILRADKSFRSTVYDGVLFTSDAEADPAEALVGPRNLRMQDSDIWSHAHRMYLLGENSVHFPWYVPKDFPARALNPENKDKLIRFAKSRQDVLSWTGLQKDTYVLSRIFCPPLSNLIHRCFRKRHFTALQD